MARSRSRVLPGASPSPTIAHCSIPRSCLDRVDAHLHRVTGGDRQADLAGHESLPVFEPARVVTDDVGIADPGGGLEIDERHDGGDFVFIRP